MAGVDMNGPGRPRARTTIAACVVAVAFAALASTAAAAATPTPLQTRLDVDELAPTALQAYEAWSQSSNSTPNHSDVFGVGTRRRQPVQDQRCGDEWLRAERRARDGERDLPAGGTTPSNLYYFNITTTHVRSPLVLQVNTPAWEYYGVGSKRYVAFMRLTGTGAHARAVRQGNPGRAQDRNDDEGLQLVPPPPTGLADRTWCTRSAAPPPTPARCGCSRSAARRSRSRAGRCRTATTAVQWMRRPVTSTTSRRPSGAACSSR